MSDIVCYVMEEKVKHRMGTGWKALFIIDGIILVFLLALLIHLKAIWI